MRRIVEWIIAGAIGGAIVWLITRPKLENYEQRLSALENRTASVENRILEFQSTYHNDKADILYQYSLLKRDIEQLKQTALPLERKKELDAWLNFLEEIKTKKMREPERVKTKPLIYLA